jgi:hypothetical protein
MHIGLSLTNASGDIEEGLGRGHVAKETAVECGQTDEEEVRGKDFCCPIQEDV